MTTEAQKELDILQTAKQTLAYLDGVALLKDVDPLSVVNLIQFRLQLRKKMEAKQEVLSKSVQKRVAVQTGIPEDELNGGF